jgi:tRNA modification GTPase
VLTAHTAIAGWPVEMADTAGLRNTDDPLERRGNLLARRQMQAAELVVMVFDSGRRWTRFDADLVRAWPAALVVHSKTDLPEAPASPDRPRGIRTSAVSGAGLDELLAAIAERLVPQSPEPGAAIPFTARQRRGLDAAAAALSQGAVERALEYLDRLLDGLET